MTEQNMVRKFHKVFGVPIAEAPAIPSQDRVLLRERLLTEEYEEYIASVNAHNLIATADALADMVYIIYGTALEYGIDLHAVFAEVHRSNMSKLLPDGSVLRRKDGKVLKSNSYSPPDIAGVLGLKKEIDG